MGQPLVKFEHVDMAFTTKRQSILALQDINLHVDKHEFVSIIGPSGCGKSTIIRLMDNIIQPSAGDIYLEDYKYEKEVPQSVVRKFGFVFQVPNLLPWKTVRQNIMFPNVIFENKDPKWEKIVDDLIQRAGIADIADVYPKTLSGGMLQMVGTLRAMSYQPEILLMDEPFGALDELLRQKLDMETMKLWDELDQTIVFITHNVLEAAFVSDRIYVMDTTPGRIINEVKVDLPRPRTPEIMASREFVELTDYLLSQIQNVDLRLVK